MQAPPPPLCALPWTADLVTVLADTSAAIARLDARVCASFVAPAWRLRASWQGYATALRLEHFPIEEIDIISHRCRLRVNRHNMLQSAPDAPCRQLTEFTATALILAAAGNILL